MPVKRDLTGVELERGLKGFEGLVENRTDKEGGFSVKMGFLRWDFC